MRFPGIWVRCPSHRSSPLHLTSRSQILCANEPMYSNLSHLHDLTRSQNPACFGAELWLHWHQFSICLFLEHCEHTGSEREKDIQVQLRPSRVSAKQLCPSALNRLPSSCFHPKPITFQESYIPLGLFFFFFYFLEFFKIKLFDKSTFFNAISQSIVINSIKFRGEIPLVTV